MRVLAGSEELTWTKRELVSTYVEIFMKDAIESVPMINGDCLIDTCQASVENDIDFEDIEKQIKEKCEKVIKNQLDILLNEMQSCVY